MADNGIRPLRPHSLVWLDSPSAEPWDPLSSLSLDHPTCSSLLPSWLHQFFTFVDASSGKPTRFHVSPGLPASLHRAKLGWVPSLLWVTFQPLPSPRPPGP